MPANTNSIRPVAIARLKRVLTPESLGYDSEATFPSGQTVYLLGLVEDKGEDKAFIVTTCALDLSGVSVGWTVEVALDAIEVSRTTTVDALRRTVGFDRELADRIERCFAHYDDQNDN